MQSIFFSYNLTRKDSSKPLIVKLLSMATLILLLKLLSPNFLALFKK